MLTVATLDVAAAERDGITPASRRSRTTPASRSATSRASSAVDASTITRTRSSVPEGRSSTRPVSPSAASSSATAAASTGSSSVRDLSTSGTLTSTCGKPGDHGGEVGQRPAGRGHPLQHVQRGEDAVAGGGVLAHDHVAGLLAAERVAADPHRLEHVAVADLGLPHAEPGARASPGRSRGCSSRSRRRCPWRAGRPRPSRARGSPGSGRRRRRCPRGRRPGSGRRRRRGRSRRRRRARGRPPAADRGGSSRSRR